jgi:hypothetical protein
MLCGMLTEPVLLGVCGCFDPEERDESCRITLAKQFFTE